MMKLLAVLSLFLLAHCIASEYSQREEKKSEELTLEFEFSTGYGFPGGISAQARNTLEQQLCRQCGLNLGFGLAIVGTVTYASDKFSVSTSHKYENAPDVPKYQSKEDILALDMQLIGYTGSNGEHIQLASWSLDDFEAATFFLGLGDKLDFTRELVGQKLASGQQFGPWNILGPMGPGGPGGILRGDDLELNSKPVKERQNVADFNFWSKDRSTPSAAYYYSLELSLMLEAGSGSKRDVQVASSWNKNNTRVTLKDTDLETKGGPSASFTLRSLHKVGVSSKYGNLKSRYYFQFESKLEKHDGKDMGGIPFRQELDFVPVLRGVLGYNDLLQVNARDTKSKVEDHSYNVNYLYNADYMKIDMVIKVPNQNGRIEEHVIYTWNINDHIAVLASEGNKLDFTQELVGQPTIDGATFGDAKSHGESGEFIMFPINLAQNFALVPNRGESLFSTFVVPIGMMMKGGPEPFDPFKSYTQEELISVVSSVENKVVGDIEVARFSEPDYNDFVMRYIAHNYHFNLASFKPLKCAAPAQPKFGVYQDCLYPLSQNMECYAFSRLFKNGDVPTSCEVKECNGFSKHAFSQECHTIKNNGICTIDAVKQQVCVKRAACVGSAQGDSCGRVYEFAGTATDDIDICTFKKSLASIVAPANEGSMQFKSKQYCH